MKTLTYVAIAAVVGLSLWHMLDKDGHASRAVENAVENVGLAMEEKTLAQQPLIIRKSMLEQREQENREWTSDNISKHPDLYLAHCGKMLEHFQEQYDAAIIDVTTTINLYRRELSDAQEASAPLLGFLKEAKKALADPKIGYPAKVGVFTYKDADHLKAAVLATDEKLSESEKLEQMRKSQLEQLQKAHSDLAKGRDRVKKERKELDGRIARAKANDLAKAVDGLHARMNALLSSIDAIPGGNGVPAGEAGEPSAPRNVDDVFSRRGIK